MFLDGVIYDNICFSGLVFGAESEGKRQYCKCGVKEVTGCAEYQGMLNLERMQVGNT